MARYLAVRLLSLIPVLFGVSLVVFFLIRLIPGDVAFALAGPGANEAELNLVREALGLNQPIWVQYFTWLGRVLSGDLGRSIEYKAPVLPLLLSRFQNTIVLASAAVVFAAAVGILAGIVSATRPRSLIDRVTMVLALFGNCMPSFWLGLVLMLTFALRLGWLPATGMYSVRADGGLTDLLAHLVLPALTLGAVSAAIIARMMRSSLLEVLGQEYIKTAHAKGLSEFRVISRHALKNAFLPVLTVIGVQIGFLLGGAVLTETIFQWPGLGLQLYRAISTRDFPVIQGGVLLIATTFVVVNLVVDILYSYLDPRIRYN